MPANPSLRLVRGDAAPQPHPWATYKWWLVFMLWFICFFNYADRQAISAVFPKLEQEFGFNKVQLGLIGSVFAWVYAAGAPFAGYIVDRFNRKKLILGGCLFWSAVTISTGWCGKLWQFVTVRALEGLGETFYFPASLSLMSDYHGPRTRSRALAIHNSSVYVGTILGSWLGAWFAETIGWRFGFYFFGGMGMLLALILFRFLREPKRAQSEEVVTENAADTEPPLAIGPALRHIFRKPTVWLLMLVFLGANFVAVIFLTWTPTFLVEKFHFKLAAAGLNGTVYIQLASVVSAPMAGYLADRFTRRLAGGRILVQALGLLVGAGFIFLVGSTHTITTLFIAMTGFGFCKGFYDSGIFASLFDAVEPRTRGAAAGLMNTVGWGGGALGPLAVGWFTMHGGQGSEMANMSQAISFGGLIYLVGAALLFLAIFVFARRDLTPVPFTKP